MPWLRPAANAVIANRQHADDIEPWRRLEHRGSEMISASLDHYRAMRDASAESLFFSLYANPFLLHFADRYRDRETAASTATDPRELPFVKEALASIGQGGYDEAVARAAFLLARTGEPLPLSRLATQRNWLKPTPSICRSCHPTSGGAFAASRNSSRLTSRSRLSRRFRRCSPNRKTASGC